MTYYYVTKYALTEGVLMVSRDKAKIFADGRSIHWGTFQFAHGNDWHETREAAEQRVDEMKARKRKSLAKSLEKLDEPVKWVEQIPEGSSENE